MEIWAIVVAGGSGTRFGRPKQLALLAGRRVIEHSIDAMRSHVAGIVVVGSSEIGTAGSLDVASVVDGGETRSASVRCGLAAVPASASHVLIHDAARPLVSADLVERVVAALISGAPAVVPVIALADTLRCVDGGTVDRSRLLAVQTPQGFDLATLMAAHAAGFDATDDATVVEQSGTSIAHVEGSPINLKITLPHDLVVAEALLGSLQSLQSTQGT